MTKISQKQSAKPTKGYQILTATLQIGIAHPATDTVSHHYSTSVNIVEKINFAKDRFSYLITPGVSSNLQESSVVLAVFFCANEDLTNEVCNNLSSQSRVTRVHL